MDDALVAEVLHPTGQLEGKPHLELNRDRLQDKSGKHLHEDLCKIGQNCIMWWRPGNFELLITYVLMKGCIFVLQYQILK